MSKHPSQTQFYKFLNFPFFDTKNGMLFMFQEGDDEKSLPFNVKKVLTMKGMNGSHKRGGHTHFKTNQILIAINGGCTVDLDNGTKKTSLLLEGAHQGLLLYPFVWHTMHSFKPDTTLLVLADMIYDESDYIRNYDDFLQQLQKIIRK